ncbi:hypothetical protein LTR84_000952 [Exophiala bonariae]|uniref:Uncharacterized protein n=1 Tax=Exophiala bonariae TaxID=1690606 RepID=A0AAV9NT13_9EURO|nr:hypothetical protein LTR84_000952 [Exophiala bonariae]
MSIRKNKTGMKDMTTEEFSWVESLFRVVPPAFLLIAVILVVFSIRASVRKMLELCGKGLEDGRLLSPDEDHNGQALQPLSNADFEEQLSIASSSDNYVARQERVRQWQQSFPLRSRSRLTSELQDKRYHPFKRRRSTSKGRMKREQHISLPALPPQPLKPQRQDTENSPIRRASKGIKAPFVIKQARKRSVEKSEQFQATNIARNGNEEEPLDSWREIIVMDDWKDFQGPELPDKESENEELSLNRRPRIDLMKSLDVSGVDQSEDTSSPPRLRGPIPKAYGRDNGEDDFYYSDVEQAINVVRLRGGGRDDYTAYEDDEEEDESDDEGLATPFDPYANDEALKLSRYPARRPTDLRTASTVSNQEDALQERIRAVFRGRSSLDINRNESIEDADPSISISRPEPVPTAPGPSRNTQTSSTPRRKVYSVEIAEEYDDIVADLDAMYSHLALCRRKFNQVLRQANKTDKPMLRHIILSNNELQTRETELATLREYVVNRGASLAAPNAELFAAVEGYIEREDRRLRLRDIACDSEEGGHPPYSAPRWAKPWGWTPPARSVRGTWRRTPVQSVEDGHEGSRRGPSSVSRAVGTSHRVTHLYGAGDRLGYRRPREHARPSIPMQELDGTQVSK